MRTEMDTLVMEDFILYKEEQPSWKEGNEWRDELILD
jgi:carbamoyltransferase